MKALSLWEPWASLIRVGAKRIETRGHQTHYRGRLLICAAKGGLSLEALLTVLQDARFQGALYPLRVGCGSIGPRDLHFGKAVAIATVSDCRRVEAVPRRDVDCERAFGDYRPGRWCWMLSDIQQIDPFPVSGMQGIFDVHSKEVERYEY